jgi:hypothetical protein
MAGAVAGVTDLESACGALITMRDRPTRMQRRGRSAALGYAAGSGGLWTSIALDWRSADDHSAYEPCGRRSDSPRVKRCEHPADCQLLFELIGLDLILGTGSAGLPATTDLHFSSRAAHPATPVFELREASIADYCPLQCSENVVIFPCKMHDMRNMQI